MAKDDDGEDREGQGDPNQRSEQRSPAESDPETTEKCEQDHRLERQGHGAGQGDASLGERSAVEQKVESDVGDRPDHRGGHRDAIVLEGGIDPEEQTDETHGQDRECVIEEGERSRLHRFRTEIASLVEDRYGLR